MRLACWLGPPGKCVTLFGRPHVWGGGDDKCMEVFGRNPEEKRPLERRRGTREDGIKIDRKY